MYKEESKKEPLPFRFVVMLVIIETAFLIGMNYLSIYIKISQGATELVTLAVIGATFYYIYKRKHYSYVYIFIGEEIIFKRKIGLKEHVLLRFKKKDILEINKVDPITSKVDKSIYMTRKRYLSHYAKDDIYYCIYGNADAKHYVEFRMSEKFYTLLKQSIKKQ